MNSCDLFVVCGEASGDRLAALFVEKMAKKKKDLSVRGVLGPRLRTLGYLADLPMESFQKMGFSEVIKSLPKTIFHFMRIKHLILRLNPSAILLVDFTTFNIELAKQLRKKGYKGFIAQLGAPTVWAWKKERIKVMAENFNLLGTLYPFEPDYFLPSGLKTIFVGHPLAKQIEPSKKHKSLLAIFPGSRKHVVESNLKEQLKAALSFCERHTEFEIGISVASLHLLKSIQSIVRQQKSIAKVKLYMPHELCLLYEDAQIAVATSGTITLELGLRHIPTVVCYKLNTMDLIAGRYLFKILLANYCIVNILKQKRVMPELIGPLCTKENIEQELYSLLTPSRYDLFSDLSSSLANPEGEEEFCQIVLKNFSSRENYSRL